MKALNKYLKESVDVTNVSYDDLNDVEYNIFLTIENTRDLWERYAALMRSAKKHEKRGDYSVERLAGSSAFFKIIVDGVKEAERCGGERIGRLSKESKMRIAAVLIDRWEE